MTYFLFFFFVLISFIFLTLTYLHVSLCGNTIVLYISAVFYFIILLFSLTSSIFNLCLYNAQNKFLFCLVRSRPQILFLSFFLSFFSLFLMFKENIFHIRLIFSMYIMCESKYTFWKSELFWWFQTYDFSPLMEIYINCHFSNVNF